MDIVDMLSRRKKKQILGEHMVVFDTRSLNKAINLTSLC